MMPHPISSCPYLFLALEETGVERLHHIDTGFSDQAELVELAPKVPVLTKELRGVAVRYKSLVLHPGSYVGKEVICCSSLSF